MLLDTSQRQVTNQNYINDKIKEQIKFGKFLATV